MRAGIQWAAIRNSGACGAVGIAAGVAIAAAGGATLKMLVPTLGCAAFLLIVVLSRRPERWCLFAFFLAVPLPMHAFFLKLEPLHGGGALGVYLVASDVPLILLYLLWFRDWIARRPLPRRSNRLWLALVPFLVVGALSAGYAPRPIWALCESLRWVKVLLIVVYMAKRLERSDLPFCFLSIGGSVVAESAVAVLQYVKRSNLGLDKLGVFGSGGDSGVAQELLTGQTLFRGAGLTGHPNFLASYLLLVLPAFGLLALADTRRYWRIAWLGVFACGLAGLVSTMSRAAWASFVIAGAAAIVAAVPLRLVPARRLIAFGTLVVLAALVGGMSMESVILERFRVDFSESWKLRVELNDAALAIVADHPVGGVGLNNYTVAFPDYDPSMASLMDDMDHMITVVHNVHLLVWAEVGTLGFASFLGFFAAVFVIAGRGLPFVEPWARAAMLGAIAGIGGALLFDLTEVSLWMEIGMYTVGFLAGACEPLAARQLARAAAWRRAPSAMRPTGFSAESA